MPDNSRATRLVQRRYDRFASQFDSRMGMMERFARKWRQLQWSMAEGSRMLEVGVGTGLNFAFYPPQTRVVAVDLSPKMLQQAHERAVKDNVNVDQALMDAQKLAFPDDTFDSVLATYVFCSVPDPIAGLRELRRVCKPGGKVVLMEHVRSKNPVMGFFMDLWNPLLVRIGGENINRRTVENVAKSGLVVERATSLWSSIFYLIEARK